MKAFGSKLGSNDAWSHFRKSKKTNYVSKLERWLSG
jgi:hypothetical protein